MFITSRAQEGSTNPLEYGFQINELSIPFLLPQGYEPVLTVELDKDLEPNKRYEVTFLVTAQKNREYSRYAYDLWVFPANFTERTVDKDRELSKSHEIFPRVAIDELRHYEEKFLTFTVSPNTTYSYLTFGVKTRGLENFRMRDYVKISAVFVRPLDVTLTDKQGLPRTELPKLIADRKAIDNGKAFTVNSAKIQIVLYDHLKNDGDIVTVYLNDKIIVDKVRLRGKKKKFKAQLRPGANTIALHAENLGEIPPNTAAIEILGGKQKIEQVLRSDLNQSEFFTIYYEQQEKK